MDITKLIKALKAYYPDHTSLDESEIADHPFYEALRKRCTSCYDKKTNWENFLRYVDDNLAIKVIDYSFLLNSFNPSYTAYVLSEQSNPYWLTVKVSVIEPVYLLYYDNRSPDQHNRFIRVNAITESEKNILSQIQEGLLKFYPDHSPLDLFTGFYQLSDFGEIKTYRRKPFLDECLFGPYLSIHA